MTHLYTPKEALRIIMKTAQNYHLLLENNNFIFLYKNRETNAIEFFEAIFLARHFQHLTGVDYINPNTETLIKNSVDFYRKCLKNNISEKEIRFRKDGTTQLKLEALPKLVQFLHFSKMTVTYNKTRPKLNIDRFAGTTNYCLGFTQDGKYYMPSSCLLEDIRTLGNQPSQILAVLQRPCHSPTPIYANIRYVAKGVPLNKLSLPPALSEIINLNAYINTDNF